MVDSGDDLRTIIERSKSEGRTKHEKIKFATVCYPSYMASNILIVKRNLEVSGYTVRMIVDDTIRNFTVTKGK